MFEQAETAGGPLGPIPGFHLDGAPAGDADLEDCAGALVQLPVWYGLLRDAEGNGGEKLVESAFPTEAVP